MRKILLFLIAATSFHFIFSQNILIISSGEAWSDPEHQEIYKYFSTDKKKLWFNYYQFSSMPSC